nr:MAG TPA: hypothetical protein [Caudoviricetes sp.]
MWQYVQVFSLTKMIPPFFTIIKMDHVCYYSQNF